jgi:predicted site-specific integrase-resolvase
MSKKRLKVSTYATLKGVSTTTVYNWVEKGKIKLEVIDGVKFIIVDNE